MDNEIMEIEMNEDNYDIETTETTETEEGMSAGGKFLVGAGIVAAIGGAIYWFKNKDQIRAKRAERQAEKLRKQGWLVKGPDELEDCDIPTEYDGCEVETG
jgi:uncharacterized membrane protein YidH (DUF202 family)